MAIAAIMVMKIQIRRCFLVKRIVFIIDQNK
jgi:hypothetical protein